MEVCPLCHEESDDLTFTAEQWLIDLIAREHPTWVHSDGACPKCRERYQKQADEK